MPRFVTFDRAADSYDATRVLPAEAAEAVTDQLAAQIGSDASCVEIGVGTGRIGLPLAARGVDLAGVDVSRPMLERLRTKVASTATGAVALVEADATRLPFPDASFDAAIASHVLHLISEWSAAVDELLRVVRPSGVVLITRGGTTPAVGDLNRRLAAAAGGRVSQIGVDRLDAVDDHLAGRGWSVEHLTPIADSRRESVAGIIDSFADGIWAWTWPMAEDRRRAAAGEVRLWAETAFPDGGATLLPAPDIRWRAYRRSSFGA